MSFGNRVLSLFQFCLNFLSVRNNLRLVVYDNCQGPLEPIMSEEDYTLIYAKMSHALSRMKEKKSQKTTVGKEAVGTEVTNLRNVNKYRTQLNGFLSYVWQQTPRQAYFPFGKLYHCIDGDYVTVLAEVSKFVHRVLFWGLETVTFRGRASSLTLFTVTEIIQLLSDIHTNEYNNAKRPKKRKIYNAASPNGDSPHQLGSSFDLDGDLDTPTSTSSKAYSTPTSTNNPQQ